jgi:mRNA-degrading endonuclease toxin of MazEF toxin-antitoxin module
LRLDRGTVVLVDPEPAVGHEQRGVRPCVVVSDPEVVADQRFPLVGVALIDQLRSVDKRRLRRASGRLPPAELAAIDVGLCAFLGLEGPAAK